MDPTLQRRLVEALRPLTSRVRTDVTARKGAQGSYWTHEPLTDAAMLHHVNGGPARGVCPIHEGSSVTMVGLLDFDSHRGETPWAEMVEVASRVNDVLDLYGLRATPFRSSGGHGIHLIMLWDEPQDAYSVRECLAEVLSLCGLRSGTKGVRGGEVEVFPRQDEVGQGEYGNQFILPLAGKSELLEPLLGWEPMGKDGVLTWEWISSEPVPVRQKPVREAVAAKDADPLDRVESALFAIPNEGPDYDRWFGLMCAVHEATGGSDEGRELFSKWSALIPEHDQRSLDYKWRSIDAPGAKRNVVTRGTLYHEAHRHGWSSEVKPDAEGFDDVEGESAEQARALAVAERERRGVQKHEAKTRWKKTIGDAQDEIALQEVICPEIALDHSLDSVDREMLADAIKVKFASWGTKLSIAACRKLIAPRARTERMTSAPEWTEGWVYVTDVDQFYRLDSEEFVSAQGFNAKFNRCLPPPKEGELPRSAHRVALDEVGIPTCTRTMYVPWCGPLFEVNGVQCANLYRQSSVPPTAGSFTAEGRKVISMIERHVKVLCGGREKVARLLLSWMAYNVQNPGKKVRWAPLVKGIEGDGKSLLGRIMSATVGHANVKNISPKVLSTDFTGWAHGACIGVLEEIRLTGHNRYDIHNALKPFITNDDVPIHAKGKDEYNAMNTMNYIAFTNHADALPLTDNDRRYFVIFTPFAEIAELEAVIGCGAGDYFGQIFDGIGSHGAELRKWLLEMPLDVDFKPEGRAPSTEEKSAMVDLGVGPEEDAVKAALQAGGIGVGASVLAVRYLRDLARQMDPDVELSDMKAKAILQKLGWRRFTEQVSWRGSRVRVWYRGAKTPARAVLTSVLDATLTSDMG